MGGGRAKKGFRANLVEGFTALRLLDNTNVYGVILSEMISNIFKEGMWFKALTPYMLILTDNDPAKVANMLTLNGITRAVVGVYSGHLFINTWGVEVIWVVTGFVGMVGIVVNVICLRQSSIDAAYALCFVWAVYNGLWNSCLETSWSKSIIRSWREDVNGARQITNKVTTAMGPLFSALIFIAYGNDWTINLVQGVMLFGTAMTTFTVLLCFFFRVSEEVVEDILLRDISKLVFNNSTNPNLCQVVSLRNLTFNDFVPDASGFVLLTYPVLADFGDDRSSFSRIKIMTKDFRPSDLILVKQFSVSLRDAPQMERTCVVVFENDIRSMIRVDLTSMDVFLKESDDPAGPLLVDRGMSEVHCKKNPLLSRAPRRFMPVRVLMKIILGYDPFQPDVCKATAAYKEALIEDTSMDANSELEDHQNEDLIRSGQADRERAPNLWGANVIVTCDVLNALGAGFSLKFIDLFLKVDHGFSPAGVFMVAFFQNIVAAVFTPYVKGIFGELREQGYRAKLGVIALWCAALVFLGLVCWPATPTFVVVPSIILMQSLNACTRAYNRAALINYLPREKIATYMAWDALNKANQGGVAIFGGMVVAMYGYRGCFFVTWIIFLIRILIYLAFTLRKGTVKRGSYIRSRSAVLPDMTSSTNLITCEAMDATENFRDDGFIEEESQLFSSVQAWQEESQDDNGRSRVASRFVTIDAETAFGFQGSDDLQSPCNLPLTRRKSSRDTPFHLEASVA